LDSAFIRITDKICDRLRLRDQLAQQIESLSFKVSGGVDHACNVAARPVEAVDEPKFDWIAAKHENNRGRGCDTLRCYRGYGAARRNDHFSLAAEEIVNHWGNSRRLPICPAPINRHILSLDIACGLQALSEPVRERLAGRPPSRLGLSMPRKPISGTAGCYARATTGHAAALPNPAMNVRLFIE
jgi:hypothetical protein